MASLLTHNHGEKAGAKYIRFFRNGKLFHNLRASRQTELAQYFAEHVVCQWIGNSQAVAREHYLRVTDQDFSRAATLTMATSGESLPKSAPPSVETAHQNALHATATPHRPETTKASNPCRLPSYVATSRCQASLVN
jgi:hypothetical protein